MPLRTIKKYSKVGSTKLTTFHCIYRKFVKEILIGTNLHIDKYKDQILTSGQSLNTGKIVPKGINLNNKTLKALKIFSILPKGYFYTT